MDRRAFKNNILLTTGVTKIPSFSNNTDGVKSINLNFNGSLSSFIQLDEAASGLNKKENLTLPLEHQSQCEQHPKKFGYDGRHQRSDYDQHQRTQIGNPEEYRQRDQDHEDPEENLQGRELQSNVRGGGSKVPVYCGSSEYLGKKLTKFSVFEALWGAATSSLNETTINPLRYKSLSEMGYTSNGSEDWEEILQPPKKNLYILLREILENSIKPNIQIRIGDVIFYCHMMVLQCYSEYFRAVDNIQCVQLPEDKVTPYGFSLLYTWMLNDKPNISRNGLLELLNAANLLNITQLINQCWAYIEDETRFSDINAFLLHLESYKYNVPNLDDTMLVRIYKFFLTLVAYNEFLDLTAKEVITLLNSNTIGVNTEIEVLFSAVRWLNHDWKNREQYVVDIMKTVRFGLMALWFLVKSRKATNCCDVGRILSKQEIQNMIDDGITYVTIRRYCTVSEDEFLGLLNRYKIKQPMQRQWIYDKECRHHHRSKCPNYESNVTYKNFLDYLTTIQKHGIDYWHTLEMVNNLNGEDCCSPPRFPKVSF